MSTAKWINKMWHIYKQQAITQHNKGRTIDTQYNMDGLQKPEAG